MNEHSNTNGRGAQLNGAPPRRTIGLWMATALVVGNMIGSGVFLLPSALAAAAGPVSLVGWVFTGAGAVLLALVFANLGREFPAAGGPYAHPHPARTSVAILFHGHVTGPAATRSSLVHHRSRHPA